MSIIIFCAAFVSGYGIGDIAYSYRRGRITRYEAIKSSIALFGAPLLLLCWAVIRTMIMGVVVTFALLLVSFAVVFWTDKKSRKTDSSNFSIFERVTPK